MLRLHIRKEHDMGTTKLLAAAAAALMIGGLSGCATPGDQAGVAARHQHLRDAKQGPAASTIATAEQAPKLLHDHREMK
jgi:hypothetical protein